MNQLFCDGGVIGANPSAIGGTWAVRLIGDDGQVLREATGWITPQMAQMPIITNNLTEMLALLKGLRALPTDWCGLVCSDSQITLGRAFQGWKWSGIPAWMHEAFRSDVSRLTNWEEFRYMLLDGHPTKAQLAAGVGKRGHPVSEHNVWCDQACREAGERFMRQAEQANLALMVPA